MRARAEEAQREEEARRALTARYETLLARAHIPPEYTGWTLENFPRVTRAVSQTRKWCAGWDGRTGLILFGDYGVGKTSLMIGALKDLALRRLQAGRSATRARFMRASELFTQLRAAMDGEEGEYADLMTQAQTISLFVLDDLGRENPKSDWMSETLFEIIDARYTHGLPIFATTNFTPETLGARLGVNAEAILQRLNDRCDWLKVTGQSMRRAGARMLE